MSLLLGRALALSVMFHAFALAYLGTRLPEPVKRISEADLLVLLREAPKPPPPPEPSQVFPEPPRANPTPPKPRADLRKKVPEKKKPPAKKKLPEKKKPPPKSPAPLRLPYPLEAVARGLEGDVLVRVILDDTGNVVASRVESSSGHALLDDAALQAVRGLRGLPDNMPRETLLPVRFRLR